MIVDLELTFSQSVSQGDIDALVLEATKDGKLGELEVSEIKVGGLIEGRLLFPHILKQLQIIPSTKSVCDIKLRKNKTSQFYLTNLS